MFPAVINSNSGAMMEPVSDDLLTNCLQYACVGFDSKDLKWKMNIPVPTARKDRTYSKTLTSGANIAQISISLFAFYFESKNTF